jgi:hypothetical protein
MPYKSNAQRKKFHAMLKRGEIDSATVREYDEASRGKKLPEHVGRHNPLKGTRRPRARKENR